MCSDDFSEYRGQWSVHNNKVFAKRTFKKKKGDVITKDKREIIEENLS